MSAGERPVSAKQLQAAAAELGRRLQAAGARVVTVESCTGGLIAAALTETAGSSAWFDRGLVTYSNEAKIELAGVSPDTLARHGAVSEEVAREMASAAALRERDRFAIAVTGIAGPGGGSGAKPVGTVCFGWAGPWGIPLSQTVRFAGDRGAVRSQAALHALLEALRVVPGPQHDRSGG